MCSHTGLDHAFNYARVALHFVLLVSIKKQSGSKRGPQVVNRSIRLGAKYITDSAFIDEPSSKGRVYRIR